MAIDVAFLDRIVALGTSERVMPGGAVLILGDCKFFTPWSRGSNSEDLSYLKQAYGLRRVETADIAGQPSIRLDLQKPVPDELVDQFDMIIDAGTLFWCFDVAAVLENCLKMLKDRGVVIHVTALTGHLGRGYYNIHPKMFVDFYTQNDFEVLSTEVRVHKQMSRLAMWQRRLWEWRGLSVGEFRPIAKDAVYLKHANFVSMEFTNAVAANAPMLPNDALFLCAARRDRRSAFVRPVP